MTKFTRLNRINHYHDSGSKKLITKSAACKKSSSIKTTSPTTTDCSSTSSEAIDHQIESDRPPSSIVDSLLTTKSVVNMIINSNAEQADDETALSAPASSRKFYRTRANVLKSKINSQKLKQQQFAFFTFITITLILLLYINQAYSLNCYHCSSMDNPDCDEAFTGRANFTETDCEKHIGRPAKVCRKIVQYIEHKKVVIRSCGYIDEAQAPPKGSTASPEQSELSGKQDLTKKSMCYKRSGTFAIMMESCNCYTDNCNHSASLVPNRSVLILASSCSLLFALKMILSGKLNN